MGGLIDYERHIDQVLERAPDEAFLIAETGYNTSPLSADFSEEGPPQCEELIAYSDARQRDYFDALVISARKWNMEFLGWWSNRDVFTAAASESCPCEDPEGFCWLLDVFRDFSDPSYQGDLSFKAFGTMGIRDWYGNPKPLMDRWMEVLEEERSRP